MANKNKHDGDTTFNKLRRLLALIRFVAERGSQGASWKDIRREVYCGDPDDQVASTKDDPLFRKFTRDRNDINANLYLDNDDDDYSGNYECEELAPDTAIIKRNKENGRYIIRNGLNLMLPMSLRKEEALALMSGVRLIPEFIAPLNNASNKLWLRLKNQMSQEILDECEFLTSATISAIPMAAEVGHDVFMNILEALHEKQIININKYVKAWPDDLEQCKFAPQVLYMRHHSWYVLGEVSGEQRILRLDRIKSATLSDEYQEDPLTLDELKEIERDIQLDYNPFEKAPANGWNIKLRITGSFVQPCMETQWFPDEKKILSSDGKSLIYEVKLKGLEAITLWIMRALNCMEIIEPAELRKRIDRRVKEYLQHRNATQN